MTPTKTFRLTKRNKTMLALLPFKDQSTRAAFKHMMIDAQLCGDAPVRSSKERDPK